MQFLRAKNHSVWIDIAMFGVVLFLFLYSAFKITKNKKQEPLQNSTLQAEDLRTVDRVPASRIIKKEDNSVQVLDLGCLPLRQKKFHVKSSYLRLAASNCMKGKLATANGINETNGYDFTCFLPEKSSRLASNFFLLNQGTNAVRIHLLWANGRKQDELLEIERVSP